MTMRNSLATLFLLIFIQTTIFANDILTDYRLHGVVNIEQSMDKALSKRDYWYKYLQNKDTSFGYLESYNNILTCNKSDETLCVYKKNAKQIYKLSKKYNAFTGKNSGEKHKEGDLKTPIGIYKLTKKLSHVDPFYGPFAFVTSYPNTFDKYKKSEGHGIWIHGLPLDEERDSFTKGCIAINNDNIQNLDKSIDINKTLLIIDAKNVQQNISKKKLSLILANLYAWRYAWLYNNVDDYLAFYSKDFRRFDGKNYNSFVHYKKRIFRKKEKKKIIFSDINVVPYPGTPNLFRISFKEYYKSRSFEFTGDKVLIVKFTNKQFKILTEK